MESKQLQAFGKINMDIGNGAVNELYIGCSLDFNPATHVSRMNLVKPKKQSSVMMKYMPIHNRQDENILNT